MNPYTKYGFHDGILRLTIEGMYGAEAITGWDQVHEDLNLQDGTIEFEGANLKVQHENYYEDQPEFPFGYGPVTLEFDSVEVYEAFMGNLRSVKDMRRTHGDHDGADEVSDLIRRLPDAFDVKQKSPENSND